MWCATPRRRASKTTSWRARSSRAKAELKQAGDTLQRLEPLLTNGFAKADDVDRAATAKQIAAAGRAAAEQQLNQAQIALSTLASLTAQRPGAVDEARVLN